MLATAFDQNRLFKNVNQPEDYLRFRRRSLLVVRLLFIHVLCLSYPFISRKTPSYEIDMVKSRIISDCNTIHL